jgi:hypothetical protein
MSVDTKTEQHRELLRKYGKWCDGYCLLVLGEERASWAWMLLTYWAWYVNTKVWLLGFRPDDHSLHLIRVNRGFFSWCNGFEETEVFPVKDLDHLRCSPGFLTSEMCFRDPRNGAFRTLTFALPAKAGAAALFELLKGAQ